MSLTALHNSMAWSKTNPFGFKPGDKLPAGRRVAGVNLAGELTFIPNSEKAWWDYDYCVAADVLIEELSSLVKKLRKAAKEDSIYEVVGEYTPVLKFFLHKNRKESPWQKDDRPGIKTRIERMIKESRGLK